MDSWNVIYVMFYYLLSSWTSITQRNDFEGIYLGSSSCLQVLFINNFSSIVSLQYVYIITGEELARLAKDYIKYLFGGNQSNRLRRAMYKWGRFYKKLMEKKKYDKFWLEKSIINTPTWWDSPEKYRHLFRTLSSNSDE